ncbi:MAG: hypothetical protein AAGB24_13675 [Bacteroidota bacterium]
MRVLAVIFLCGLASCSLGEKAHHTVSEFEWYGLEVTASAYNSVTWQTDGNPSIAAWGDTLYPGQKVIAVSRDLVQLGLTRNTMVKIDTLRDTFWVKDKMNRRWKNHIDIYMGTDIKKARQWGKRKLDICYAVRIDSLTSKNNLK